MDWVKGFFSWFQFSLKPIQLSHDCPIHNYKRLNLETNPIKTGYDPRGAPLVVYTPYFITNKNKYDEILDPIKSWSVSVRSRFFMVT